MNKYSFYFKLAAVLVLHDLAANALILTKRSNALKIHPAEVCFPGGGWQPGDKNLYATALREVEEEIGIPSSRIQCKKSLKPEFTLSGYCIFPWFCTIDSLMPFYIDNNEVAEIISLPLEEVLEPENYQAIEVRRQGKGITTIQYIASAHLIWGATARIMKQLSRK